MRNLKTLDGGYNQITSLKGIENLSNLEILYYNGNQITSLAGILVFTSATQGWFINKLKWYEILVFLIMSIK